MKADDLDKFVDGVPMRERIERFAGHFVETRNPLQGYRMAFVVSAGQTSQWVHEQAQKLLRDPLVMARVQELRDEAAATTLINVRTLLEDWEAIASADPNELVSHVIDSCRFCWGIDHRWQWTTEEEYAKACDDAIAAKKEMLPDMAGGFGYDPRLDPNQTCPCCFGRGLGHVVARDTTKLVGKARKLYKGAKETKQGIEILMHDQHAAREALAKVFGAFKDGIPVTPSKPLQDADANKATTPQDVVKSYLRLVSTKAT